MWGGFSISTFSGAANLFSSPPVSSMLKRNLVIDSVRNRVGRLRFGRPISSAGVSRKIRYITDDERTFKADHLAVTSRVEPSAAVRVRPHVRPPLRTFIRKRIWALKASLPISGYKEQTQQSQCGGTLALNAASVVHSSNMTRVKLSKEWDISDARYLKFLLPKYKDRL